MQKKCEVCNYKKLHNVLNLGYHPLCDDLIRISSKNKINKNYKIEILYCDNCSTAFQKYNVKKKILFPKTYHYRSQLTNDVLWGMKSLVKDSQRLLGNLKNKIILDIGCNDGSLLDQYKQTKATTIGIEPTNAGLEARKKGHKIYLDYVDAKTVRKIKNKFKRIDIITFTNVFAHIEDLNKLINNLKKMMSEKTILIIENHYLGSILAKKQFDTFYHEHPRTYSLRSFVKIAKKLNANILDYSFPKRYGGNIRVIISKNNKIKKIKFKTLKQEKLFLDKFKKLNYFVNKWKKKKNEELKLLVKKNGPLVAKAFPGRAAILIKLLNINENIISCTYEKSNSKKIGYFIPGTNIPIKSDKILFKNINKNKIIINLSWHISDEIKKYLRYKGYKGKIINILDQKDF